MYPAFFRAKKGNNMCVCYNMCGPYLHSFQWAWADFYLMPLYILESSTPQRHYLPPQECRWLKPVVILQVPPYRWSHHRQTLTPSKGPRWTVVKERMTQWPGGEGQKERWWGRSLRAYVCICVSLCATYGGGVEDVKVFLQTLSDSHRAKVQLWTTLLFFIRGTWISQLKAWVFGWEGSQRQDKRKVGEYWFFIISYHKMFWYLFVTCTL